MTTIAQTAAQTAPRPAPTSSSLSDAGREKPAYYGEQKTGMGSWSPVRFTEPPAVDKRNRLKRASGVGPILRQMGTDESGGKAFCKPIPKYLSHLTLDQLFAVLSPDGHLAATQKGGAE